MQGHFFRRLSAIWPEYAKLLPMSAETATVIAICAYLLSASLWLLRQRSGLSDRFPQAFAYVALATHAVALGLYWRLAQGPDLHVFGALSWVALAMAAISTALAAKKPLSALGVVVYPIAALALFANSHWGVHADSQLDWRLKMHVSFALLGYASLSIAAVLAILYWLQDRALRRCHIQSWLGTLPPLVQTEQLLFKTLGTSWLLLTLTLVTGLVFVQDMLAQHLWHKTVLTTLSWLTLLILLIGRVRYGWRGPRAVRWTLAAMALLALAFFGSKFVLELLLKKS
jgi:ABC-type uncharacterized transport system permease subunit